ncbi:MAG: hypothetical protein KY429_00535 [Actinobacteria bacterium]|nr:hypothetical protein [Actinomycetota bacterium]
MVDPGVVAEEVGRVLRNFTLKRDYEREETDLQPHVRAEVEAALSARFPNAGLVTTMSVGGSGRPYMKALGTSFWPDLVITDNGSPLCAVEIKLIQPGSARGIASSIGQAVIYSCAYPYVYILLAHFGVYDERSSDHDQALLERLTPMNVDVIIRGPHETPS